MSNDQVIARALGDSAQMTDAQIRLAIRTLRDVVLGRQQERARKRIMEQFHELTRRELAEKQSYDDLAASGGIVDAP